MIMTVGELIKELEKYPKNWDVKVYDCINDSYRPAKISDTLGSIDLIEE